MYAGERRIQALVRELKEELGISVEQARPLIRFRHDYPDRCVDLDVWWVTVWRGTARGLEGQKLRWVAVEDLAVFDFPDANYPIIRAVDLPALYLLTPDIRLADLTEFMRDLQSCLNAGARLIQLRAKSAGEVELRRIAAEVLPLCQSQGARVLINSSPAFALELNADGVHLSARRLIACRRRPLPAELLVAASCHDRRELRQAAAIGADFAVLGPVKETASHPGAAGIGWSEFERLSRDARMPIYALGGLRADDMAESWERGAQGLAMISGVWSASDPAAAVRLCAGG